VGRFFGEAAVFWWRTAQPYVNSVRTQRPNRWRAVGGLHGGVRGKTQLSGCELAAARVQLMDLEQPARGARLVLGDDPKALRL
jgi:hypothetical protein